LKRSVKGFRKRSPSECEKQWATAFDKRSASASDCVGDGESETVTAGLPEAVVAECARASAVVPARDRGGRLRRRQVRRRRRREKRIRVPNRKSGIRVAQAIARRHRGHRQLRTARHREHEPFVRAGIELPFLR
jgi:hypothetical protein